MFRLLARRGAGSMAIEAMLREKSKVARRSTGRIVSMAELSQSRSGFGRANFAKPTCQGRVTTGAGTFSKIRWRPVVAGSLNLFASRQTMWSSVVL